MSLNLRDLIDLPELRSRLLSGAAGVERRVRWAHVCELPDPTEWLGEGDLLMTTGLGIPVATGEQRRYLERLAEAGLAGIMIGENMQAPADLEGLRQAADQRGFPLILTEYGVPFAAVTRAIVDADRKAEHERRTALARVYESARLSMQGLGLPALLARLEKDVQVRLCLVDEERLQPWITGLPPLPEALRDGIAGRRRERIGPQAMVQRLPLGEREALTMALPTHRNCLLVAFGGEPPDYGLLHHLVAVLGIEIERLQVESERRLRLGSELLDDLLQARLSPSLARQRLGELMPGQDLTDLCLTVARPGAAVLAERGDVLRHWGARSLLRMQGEELILLHPFDLAGALQTELGALLGLSDPLGHPERCTDALREARLALAHAHPQRPVGVYAELGSDTLWLPRTLDEAEYSARLILGGLLDYDRAQGSSLLLSLWVFLEENRSWLGAARRLNVHKQTLVYRIRRIEEISGRSLACTEDVATLWFALRAAQFAGIGTLPQDDTRSLFR
ncbi:PucR family transcriptional regulator [Pseudomonas sp. Q1-7]|uniref:PucR family transcriptional regulator n=1 Tax=Pseudomonas sp. Q1-7 TaxID=3020843 RepID=UPI0023006D4D|nr:PucR family transcriptional regulator [Pseudomonas sp. Q1-7]